MKVGTKKPGKQLNKAFENHTPLLIILNRDNSDSFKAAYATLEVFCEGKTELLCGIANKDDEDYNSLNGWIGDPNNEVSRLVYIETQEFSKFLFEGELATLNTDSINEFINDIKAEKIKPHKKEEPEIEAEVVPEGQTEEQPAEEQPT